MLRFALANDSDDMTEPERLAKLCFWGCDDEPILRLMGADWPSGEKKERFSVAMGSLLLLLLHDVNTFSFLCSPCFSLRKVGLFVD